MNLCPNCTHAISLFSISAIEAQALGKLALVHTRSRGSHIASGTVISANVKEGLEQAKEWIQYSSQSYRDKDYINKARKEARHYLGVELWETITTIEGFENFSPYKNHAWQEKLEQYAKKPSTLCNKTMQKLNSLLWS